MRHLTAATATPEQPMPWGWLVVFLAVAGLLYLAACRWRPFARCWCCKGTGRHARSDGKVWRTCRLCKATGTRLRVGRRVWNRFARVRDAAR